MWTKTRLTSRGFVDGSVDQDLTVRVFALDQPTQFTLYEDDGWSQAYLNGRVRTTRMEQALEGDIARVTFPGWEPTRERRMSATTG